MSAAARKRIAGATKAMGSDERTLMATVKAEGAWSKRRITAAGRKRIIEATKKRWAAYRAQNKGAKKASTKR